MVLQCLLFLCCYHYFRPVYYVTKKLSDILKYYFKTIKAYLCVLQLTCIVNNHICHNYIS